MLKISTSYICTCKHMLRVTCRKVVLSGGKIFPSFQLQLLISHVLQAFTLLGPMKFWPLLHSFWPYLFWSNLMSRDEYERQNKGKMKKKTQKESKQKTQLLKYSTC